MDQGSGFRDQPASLYRNPASNLQANSRASCPSLCKTRRIRHSGVVPAMMVTRPPFLVVALGLSLYLVPATAVHAQQSANPAPQAQPASTQAQEPDPLNRQRSDREQFQARKAYKQELKGAFKTWLEQDVAYIIS